MQSLPYDPRQMLYVYQPIVALDAGVIGYEALLRVRGRDIGPILRAVEDLGSDAQVQFDRVTARIASRAAAPWIGESRLFVNVMPGTVLHVLDGGSWPKAYVPHVVWEIPEGLAGTRAVLKPGALVAMGDAEIALDDLGEGFGDLKKLATLPGVWCKLGRDLVRACHLSSSTGAVIRHVVHLSKELGQVVVAEGVETVEELEALEGMGVRHIQGFLYGQPAMKPVVPDLVAVRKKAAI